MLTLSRAKTIGKLAFPIILAMISVNLISLVDVYMVGQLGDNALAATTIGGFAANLLMAPVIGLNAAVQALTGRRFGADGANERLCFPLNAGLIWSLILGIPLTALSWWIVPGFVGFLNNDPGVVTEAIPYMRFFLLGIVFIGMSRAFQGYWNGLGKPIFYFSTVLIGHAVNIVMNYMFIFGNWGAPRLGVKGAAVGSLISMAVMVLAYFALGFVKSKGQGFLAGLPKDGSFKTIMRLGLPVSVQSSSFNAGYVVFIWMVGLVGTAEVAAAGVIMNLTMVAILPGMGLGISAATLVSQSLGRQEPENATQWGWDAAILSVAIMALFGFPMALFPDWVLGIFIHNPETVALARGPLRLAGLSVGMLGISFTLMHSLLGAGDNKRVMKTSISWQWGFMLPLVFLVGPTLGNGLMAIWFVQLVYCAMLVMTYILLWRGRRWQSIRI